MTVKAKIAHLTSVHSTFDTRIFHKECKTLVNAGYDLVLIKPHNCDERIDNIRIKAIYKPKNRFERITLTMWQLYKTALRENAEVYHFHDPELIFIGILLKLHRKYVIYDVHEDVPAQIKSKYWIPKMLRKITAVMVGILEKTLSRFLDGIITATPTIAKRFNCRTKEIIHNFPLINKQVITDFVPYKERSNLIVYIGSISEIRGIFEMVNAISLVPDSLDVRLLLAGNFMSDVLQEKVKTLSGWEKVNYLGWQNRSQIIELLGRARIGLVTLHPVPNYIEAYPVKLFEYMTAGIPVIASNFPLWNKIITDSGCGLLVDPLNPKEIAEAIQWILEHPDQAETMGKRGQEAVFNRYRWDTEAKKLLNFYSKILNKH